ncbi:MAG: T9SS type A sorting domain-containing protein [Candidatus Kapabacteria bacterium]|nr:T9SS type A sorting domain-containing protein [Candidatus Kapabacteria bacterium]
MKILFDYLCFLLMPYFLNAAAVHLGPGQTYPNIQAAYIAAAIHPGDTVYLHAGVYTSFEYLKLKGDSTNWIVFTRYQNDAIEINTGWQFYSSEYLRFEKLIFKGNANYSGRLLHIHNGGSCQTQSRYIIFDSCSFSGVTDAAAITAFKFGGVDNFEITNCVFKDIPNCDAINFNVCHNGIIRGNRLENCLTGGHIKGGSSDITMERNLFINASSNAWVAFELGGDTGQQFYCPGDNFEVKNLKFYSNIVIGGYRGIALSSAIDCKIINNTFYNCGQATLRFLTTSILYPTLKNNRIENNIFAFGTANYINGGSQPANASSFAKNIYYSTTNTTFNGPYWDSPELDSIKDPKPMNFGSETKIFVNYNSNDLNLIQGSPAIGAGQAETEPLYDFYGNKFATNRSIGAIEYSGAKGVKEEITYDRFLFPNPAEDYIYLPENLIKASNLKIFNSFGELKLQIKAINNKIDVKNLSNGIYFMQNGDKVYKFIKY